MTRQSSANVVYLEKTARILTKQIAVEAENCLEDRTVANTFKNAAVFRNEVHLRLVELEFGRVHTDHLIVGDMLLAHKNNLSTVGNNVKTRNTTPEFLRVGDLRLGLLHVFHIRIICRLTAQNHVSLGIAVFLCFAYRLGNKRVGNAARRVIFFRNKPIVSTLGYTVNRRNRGIKERTKTENLASVRTLYRDKTGRNRNCRTVNRDFLVLAVNTQKRLPVCAGVEPTAAFAA